jgi:hypothetical protein
MKKFAYLMIIALMSSCSPRISTHLYKSYPPLTDNQNVKVLALTDSIPVISTQLGTVKVEDSGWTTKCGYEDFIAIAKREARKAGGNAIKVIEHIPPHSARHGLAFYYYNCHQITVMILRTPDDLD